MKNHNPKKQAKTRQNVSISPKIKEMWEKMAAENDTTMSAMLTQWIKEAAKNQDGPSTHADSTPRPLRATRRTVSAKTPSADRA